MQIETVGDATLYLGDALSALASMADGSADCAMTDPPYSSGGMVRGDRLQDVHTKYVNSDSGSGNLLQAFTGDNRDQIGYWFWVSLWVGELRRVLKPGAVCALFTDWRQLPVTTAALQAGGFVWRGIVSWHKPAARPTQGRFTNACEYVVWGTNGPRELDGFALPGFYTINSPRGEEREHITQKPVELMTKLLQIAPEGGGSDRSVHGQRDDRCRVCRDRPQVHRCRAGAYAFCDSTRTNRGRSVSGEAVRVRGHIQPTQWG